MTMCLVTTTAAGLWADATITLDDHGVLTEIVLKFDESNYDDVIDMVKKNGKPTRAWTSIKQNGFGVKYESDDYRWSPKGNYMAIASRYADMLDRSSLAFVLKNEKQRAVSKDL